MPGEKPALKALKAAPALEEQLPWAQLVGLQPVSI
jgi:hypothetical protein